MPSNTLIISIPLWLLFVTTCILGLMAWEAGFRIGKRHGGSNPVSQQALTTVLGAVLGLLAFLLGFTFNMAADRFRERRSVVIEDVNAIDTAYKRYMTIDDDQDRSTVNQLFLDYVNDRIQGPESPAFANSAAIRSKIWKHVLRLSKNDRSPIAAQFIASVNHMSDVHTKRYAILSQHRIPDSIWITLLGILVLCNATLGYQNGAAHKTRAMSASILGIAFAIVIVVIADMDRPGEGQLRVDQQAMIDLRDSIGGDR